ADWLGKPRAQGGVDWGDGTVFGLGLVLFAVLVGYLAWSHRDVEGTHALEHSLASEATPDPDADPDLDLV
ncbi:MAG TPA: hypothetical protein VFE07_00370, partial [Marmoricola sp.]|nr:hypothetical protein [Marmoricola sp.]